MKIINILFEHKFWNCEVCWLFKMKYSILKVVEKNVKHLILSGHIYAYMWAMNKFFVYKLFNFWHLSNKKKFKTSKNWQCLDCKIVLARWAQIQKKCAILKGEIMLDIWGNYWYSIYWYIYILHFFPF